MISLNKTMNILRVIDSQCVISEYALDLQEGEQLSFGRSDACDISLPEEGNLSRMHCHFLCYRGRIYIRDNASVNGILCNGVSVVEAEMKPGLEFVLGLCRLSLEFRPDEAPREQAVASAPVFIPTPPAPEPKLPPLQEVQYAVEEGPFIEQIEEPPRPVGAESADESSVVIPPIVVPPSAPLPVSAVPMSDPLPISAVPLREPLPVSAAFVPPRDALPASAAAAIPGAVASAPLAPSVPTEETVRVSVKKRRLMATVAPPRQLKHAAAPKPRPKKQYTTRSVKTAAPKSAGKKKKRRLSVSEEKWVDEKAVPEATSGAVLGLPVDFVVQMRPLVKRYPMRAEDIMALTVAAEEKCYIAVIQYDAVGAPTLIVPGSRRDNTVVFPHVLTRFPQAADADYELVVEEPFGPVRLVLLACNQPCKWASAYEKAFETLGPSPYPGKLEAAIVASVPPSVEPLRWSSSTVLLHTNP